MSDGRYNLWKSLWGENSGRGKLVKKEKKADKLKPADSVGSERIVTLNDMWEAEKKRRQLEEQGHLQKLNKTGGNRPNSARGWGGVSFTGAGGTPYSVQRDLLGRGGPVLVRDLHAARLREASERAAFRALRAEENRMAQKESEAKGDWMFHHYHEIEAQRLKNQAIREAQRLKNQETRIEQAKQNYLKEQEVKQKAIELRNLKAGVNPPGSVPAAAGSQVTPPNAAPRSGKSTYVNWTKPGAPGVRIGGSGTSTVEGRAQSRVDPGESTGVAIVRGGPGSDTTAAIVEKQMRQAMKTGGVNQAQSDYQERRRMLEDDAKLNTILEEIDKNAPVAAYKGGKARRRSRLQVLSRR